MSKNSIQMIAEMVELHEHLAARIETDAQLLEALLVHIPRNVPELYDLAVERVLSMRETVAMLTE